MLNGDGNDNCKKKKKSIISNNKNNFARAAPIFSEHFFAIVLHDHNVKLSSYTYVLTKDFVTRLNVFLLAFFSLPLIFSLPASPC